MKHLKQNLFLALIGFTLLSFTACDSDDDDTNNPVNDALPRTSTLNASVTGDYTDTISISANILTPTMQGITSTFSSLDTLFTILSLKPDATGAQSINIIAMPLALTLGLYPVEAFNGGVSVYYNSNSGAQNLEAESGTLLITGVENVPVSTGMINSKYVSGQFSMIMKNTGGDSVSVTGNFKDVITVVVN